MAANKQILETSSKRTQAASNLSEQASKLKQMEKQGVEILACGTCLDRLGIMDKVAAGQVSNMYTIAETMMKATKVVSL